MVMDGSSSPAKSGSKVSKLKPETQSSKRRKVVEKTVMRVSIGENAGKLKHEGPPSDFWSWRKYGQKPIKGSPYPRGYYRCSTSKGCSAKKQVERCRADASVLVITYTSTHNHPGPDPHNLIQQPKDAETQLSDNQDPPATPDQEQDPQQQDLPQDLEEDEKEDRIKQSVNEPAVIRSGIEEEQHSFHYLHSPLTCSEEILIISEQDDPFAEKYSSHSRTEDDALGIVLDDHQDPITILSSSSSSSSSCPKVMAFPTTQEGSEENDFFNELEELPTPSAFTSFMRGNFFDERIPIVPF